MKVVQVVGARPNFMKVAPIMREMSKYDIFKQLLVHTGQHYDKNMYHIFFDEVGLPKPDVDLNVGSGTHTWQITKIMANFEKVLHDFCPDWVFVVGDVNSTLAAALVSSKLNIMVVHVEAGLRSFDRTMPEEINRVVTDQISDVLLTHSRDANENLLREGISPDKIHFVGNVMIDSLVYLLPKAEKRWIAKRQNLNIENYILVTLHRPSNVDNPVVLEEIMGALSIISKEIPVLFSVHPRTRKQMTDFDKWQSENPQLHMVEPMGYIDFLALEMHSNMVLTDSGGIQEETTYLGVPCLTVRANTERPVTITHGTNKLILSNCKAIVDAVREILSSKRSAGDIRRPPLWDGKSAERITKIMEGLA